jgi:hypothetical protein
MSAPERPTDDVEWEQFEAAVSVAYAALTDALAIHDRRFPHGHTRLPARLDLGERIREMLATLDEVADPLDPSVVKGAVFHLTTEVTIDAADRRATFAIGPRQDPVSYVIRVEPKTAEARQTHKTGVTYWIRDDFEPDLGVGSFKDAVTVAWSEFIQQLDQYVREECHLEVER